MGVWGMRPGVDLADGATLAGPPGRTCLDCGDRPSHRVGVLTEGLGEPEQPGGVGQARVCRTLLAPVGANARTQTGVEPGPRAVHEVVGGMRDGEDQHGAEPQRGQVAAAAPYRR